MTVKICKVQMMTFPQTIRSTREALGLTQAELALRLGVSFQTVNNWETGRVEPWPRKRQILLETLGVLGKGVAPSTLAANATTPPLASRRGEPSIVTTTKLRKDEYFIELRRRPNVIEEIEGKAAIEVRRPPPHT